MHFIFSLINDKQIFIVKPLVKTGKPKADIGLRPISHLSRNIVD